MANVLLSEAEKTFILHGVDVRRFLLYILFSVIKTCLNEMPNI